MYIIDDVFFLLGQFWPHIYIVCLQNDSITICLYLPIYKESTAAIARNA